MELIQNIWNSLVTPNDTAIKIITSILIFIEAYVTMLLFTTILAIKSDKKQKLLYDIIVSIIGIVARNFIPDPIGTFVNLIAMFVAIKLIFNVNIVKSLIALIFPFIITTILETISSKIFMFLFNMPYEVALTIPLYRTIFMLVTYAFIYVCALLAKKFDFNITLIDNLTKENKKVLISIFILGLVTIGLQLYITIYYTQFIPFGVSILSIIILLAYFSISLYSLSKTMKLEVAKQEVENLQLYNKTLSILHDRIRAFKHDFNNIVQAIGGYVASRDMDGLTKYYQNLLPDCQGVNNLTALNPDTINNPPIYSILASKYHKADAKGIMINLNIFIDLNTVRLNIYELTRIMGILLDNAIEAAEESNKKIINVEFRNDPANHRQLMIVENTYNGGKVDTDAIFEKSITSKEGHSGLGLWEVRQIIRKHNNLNLFTTTNGEYFIQQLEIY